jgi:hypothetical protein
VPPEGDVPVPPDGAVPVPPDGEVPVPPDGDVPVAPDGDVPVAESRWPQAPSNDDSTSADAQTADVIRMEGSQSMKASAQWHMACRAHRFAACPLPRLRRCAP